MSPEVSAVVTTHDRPAFVARALASLRAEVHRDVEIIVVDDGGSFRAPMLSRRIRVVRGSALGVARARNAGLEAARGEFVIFLDDDDVALPRRISSLVAAARRNDASLCFGVTRRVVDATGTVIDEVPFHPLASGPATFCDLLAGAPHVNAVLTRTSVLREVGGFDPGADHFDEWSAWLRVADRASAMWHVREAVAEWRLHDEGLSGRVLQLRAMKARLLALFERLAPALAPPHARAVGIAKRIVAEADIVTYDDYASAMAIERDALNAADACFVESCRHASRPVAGVA